MTIISMETIRTVNIVGVIGDYTHTKKGISIILLSFLGRNF